MPRLPRPTISVRDRFPTLERHGLAAQHFAGYTHRVRDEHGHDMVELLFVLAGRCTHLVGGEAHPLPAGTLAIVHYGMQHQIITDDGPVELMNVYLDPPSVPPPALPADLSPVLPRILPLHPALGHDRNRLVHLPFPAVEDLAPILHGLEHETRRSVQARPEAMAAWYLLLLLACTRRALELGHLPATGAGTGAMERVRARLEAGWDRRHDLAGLADLAGMTPTALCRAFRRATGRSITEYLLHRRIERALLRLAGGREPVAQVALACGFGDLSHFNRVFRRLTGSTPRAWRQAHTA